MKEITVQELKNMKDNNEDFLLVDVREPYEYERGNIDGLLLPLGEILYSTDEFENNQDKKIIIQCRSGNRSAQAIEILEDSIDCDNLYNLKGGLLAYKNEIDNSINVD